MDLLGRMEPGHFLVLLPGSSENEAKVVGERAIEALAECRLPLSGSNMQLELESSATALEPSDEASHMIGRAQWQMEEVRRE